MVSRSNGCYSKLQLCTVYTLQYNLFNGILKGHHILLNVIRQLHSLLLVIQDFNALSAWIVVEAERARDGGGKGPGGREENSLNRATLLQNDCCHKEGMSKLSPNYWCSDMYIIPRVRNVQSDCRKYQCYATNCYSIEQGSISFAPNLLVMRHCICQESEFSLLGHYMGHC